MSRSRCPACGAAVRDGAPWCLLCHSDLRPPRERQPGQIDGPVDRPVDRGSEPEARWPCSGCGADNPLAAAACATCGTGFLAGLHAADSSRLTLPVVGDIGRLSRNVRLLLAVGSGLVVALFLTGLVLLIGTLL